MRYVAKKEALKWQENWRLTTAAAAMGLLQDSLAWVHNRIVMRKVTPGAQTGNMYDCVDQHVLMWIIIVYALAKQIDIHVAFADVQKSYPNASLQILRHLW